MMQQKNLPDGILPDIMIKTGRRKISVTIIMII